LIIFLLFVILLFLGVPIVFTLLVPSILAFVFYPELPFQLLGPRLGNGFLSSSLLAIPLFIFAAQILTDIKITDAIFNFVCKCVGHIHGGLAHVNIWASVIFAGMSGSAGADAASLGKVEIQAMTDQGYPRAYSAALTAASATIGPIIPPSIPLIVFGSVAGVSIGKLLIGGIVPGVLMALMLSIGVVLVAKRRSLPKTEFSGFREIVKTGYKALPGLMAPVILIGGMLCGFFTPTEAATVAVVYAIVLGFCLKTLTLKELFQSFRKSALDSAAMVFVFYSASLIGLLVTRLHVADAAISFISGVTSSPVVLLMMINILLLIAGCFLDPTCTILLMTPILLPLVKSFGINDVHFGVLMVLNLMIGMLTPPFGQVMFVTCRVAKLKMKELLPELWPYIGYLLVALIIVTYVPQTVTWLPNLLIK
jgi:tripartite ATP-independent transporter DctM subunit